MAIRTSGKIRTFGDSDTGLDGPGGSPDLGVSGRDGGFEGGGVSVGLVGTAARGNGGVDSAFTTAATPPA